MGFQKWKAFLKYVWARTHTHTHTLPFSPSSSAELSISHAIMRTALSGAFWVKGSGWFRVQQEGRSLSQKIRLLYLCSCERILTYKAWRTVKMFLKNIFSCNSLSLSSDRSEAATIINAAPGIASAVAREDWGKRICPDHEELRSPGYHSAVMSSRQIKWRPWCPLCPMDSRGEARQSSSFVRIW